MALVKYFSEGKDTYSGPAWLQRMGNWSYHLSFAAGAIAIASVLAGTTGAAYQAFFASQLLSIAQVSILCRLGATGYAMNRLLARSIGTALVVGLVAWGHA